MRPDAVRAAEFVPCRPARGLRSFVDRYVGYRLVGFDAGVHLGVPSQHMTFIVSIGSPIDVVAQTNPSQLPDRYRFVLSGLQATSALIAHDGNQEGVAIELTPMGARALFARPARDLWDISVECSQVVGHPGDELWERLQHATAWKDRFRACDQVLSRISGGQQVPEPLRNCWRALVDSGGTIPVERLASETGYSRQHLTRRFRGEFGMGPKMAARVVRFERAHHMLADASSAGALSRVAAACGYYDQAHLARDIASLTGCTPTELLGEEVPFVQDADATVG